MGFFSSVGKLGSAGINLALTPVEAVREAGEVIVTGKSNRRTARRFQEAARNVEEAGDDFFEDDSW